MRKIAKEGPKIGAHLAIGKGLKKTADEAVDRNLETLQVFLRNPRGRTARKLKPDEIDYFRAALEKNKIGPVVVHIPYICNPASPKDDLYAFALETVKHDLERCKLVGTDLLVMHPGAYTSSTVAEGTARVAALLNRVFDTYTGSTRILLETMSGQGTELGRNFDEIKAIIKKVEKNELVGVCFDTCHLFAAGYELRTKDGIDQMLEAADKAFGLDKVKVMHVNDSNHEFESHKDRHAHIGAGFIGEEGFSNLISHPFFKDIPFIVETPLERQQDDVEKLKSMRM